MVPTFRLLEDSALEFHHSKGLGCNHLGLGIQEVERILVQNDGLQQEHCRQEEHHRQAEEHLSLQSYVLLEVESTFLDAVDRHHNLAGILGSLAAVDMLGILAVDAVGSRSCHLVEVERRDWADS